MFETIEGKGEGFASRVVIIAEIDGTRVVITRAPGDVEGEVLELRSHEVVGREGETRRRWFGGERKGEEGQEVRGSAERMIDWVCRPRECRGNYKWLRKTC